MSKWEFLYLLFVAVYSVVNVFAWLALTSAQTRTERLRKEAEDRIEGKRHQEQDCD